MDSARIAEMEWGKETRCLCVVRGLELGARGARADDVASERPRTGRCMASQAMYVARSCGTHLLNSKSKAVPPMLPLGAGGGAPWWPAGPAIRGLLSRGLAQASSSPGCRGRTTRLGRCDLGLNPPGFDRDFELRPPAKEKQESIFCSGSFFFFFVPRKFLHWISDQSWI
jgi:hypothetical protein